MSFSYLTPIDLDQAIALALRAADAVQMPTEVIQTLDAAGRVTAQAVYAAISAPHYNACAMDGIALDAKHTFGATETTPIVLPEQAYTVVDTGDPLPNLCDCVIMIENIIQTERGCMITSPAAPWQNVRPIGEDICSGEMILPSGTPISPAAVGALLAAGVLVVPVRKRPTVALIPTGDEVIAPTSSPQPGDVMEFNSAIFSAQLAQWGAQAKVYPIVRDELQALRDAVKQAAQECDVVLLGAGSSAGRGDFASEVLELEGELWAHGVAIRPGKPAMIGMIQGKPFFGIPGYPVSGMIVLEQLVHPAIAKITGVPVRRRPVATARLTRPLFTSLENCEFVRMRMGKTAQGLIATPLGRGAGVVTSMVKADGMLVVPKNREGYPVGAQVEIELLRPLEEIENAWVVIGSHDPLIDELADLLAMSQPPRMVSSAHVGSMGGILAVARGEAHFAGTHLLDEHTGEYNVSIVRAHFPGGGAVLVRGVGRTQGLMVPRSNPKAIEGIRDLMREDVRFVNRQRGSGTRVLLDHLLKGQGLDHTRIEGYAHEEMTHLAVAAQVAAGGADTGLGVIAAARVYGLDFVPIYNEQYDFLVAEDFAASDEYNRLIEMLQSAAFEQRLTRLGGYRLDGIGQRVVYDQ